MTSLARARTYHYLVGLRPSAQDFGPGSYELVSPAPSGFVETRFGTHRCSHSSEWREERRWVVGLVLIYHALRPVQHSAPYPPMFLVCL